MERIEALLASMRHSMVQYARGLGQWLVVSSYAVHPRQVVAVVGPAKGEGARLLDIAQRGYHPQRLVVSGQRGETAVPVLVGKKPLDGRATAYVCQNHACLAPTCNPQALEELLAAI